MAEKKKTDKQPVDTHEVTPEPEETPKKGTPEERARLAKKHPAEKDPKTPHEDEDKNVRTGNPLKVGVDPTHD